MFCTNCGKKIQDDIKYCPYCGAPVLPPVSAKEEPIVEEPAVEEIVEEVAVEAPVAEEIIEEVPAVDEVVEEAPAVEEVATEAPVIEDAVEETVAAEPAAEEIAEEVVAAEEITEEIAAETPVAEAVTAEAPAVEEAAVEAIAAEPAAEEITEEIAAETPVAEAVAAEAPAAEEIVEDATVIEDIVAEEPPKKKKTGLIAAIIAVIVIAAGVGGYFIYQNLPSTKLAKLRTQIAASIESKDYKSAVSQIEQAYEFAPDDAELRKQYVDCSQNILSDLYEVKDYEAFIAGTDKLIKDYPEAAETLDPLVKLAYESLANDAINTGDIPTMQAMKDRLTDLTSSGRFNFGDTINWLEANIQHVELTNLFQTLADKLLPLIKSGDRAGVFETIRNEFISGSGSARKLAPNKATVEYHFPLYSKPDENGKVLGIYYSYSHYGFYYGNYNGTRREGDAVWIIADNLKTDSAYREYWAEGTWANDRPNGTFTISNLSKYPNSEKEQLVEGTVEVSNGLYNGKGVFTYDGSAPLSGSYKNGIADVIMTTDPNGNQTNVILISEDGKAWVSRANINDPLGIYGFY